MRVHGIGQLASLLQFQFQHGFTILENLKSIEEVPFRYLLMNGPTIQAGLFFILLVYCPYRAYDLWEGNYIKIKTNKPYLDSSDDDGEAW